MNASSEPSAPLPWHVFTSPAAKWAEQPSFVVGEYLFIACALVALAHAWSQPDAPGARGGGAGSERRKHLMVWVAAILAGTANDLIFMALPMVENFWQAQATIMITPRLPLYIPCVYVCFMYFPTVATWRLNLPPLARAATTGLAAIAFYAPYDIVGAKFLWWTWHDTDKPIANRLLGVPIGSTIWVILFVSTFGWLIGRAVDRDRSLSWKTFARGIATVCAFCTLLMMLQMIPIQQLDGGVPGVRGLVTIVVAYGATAVWGWRRSTAEAPRASDRILRAAAVTYFATLMVITATFDPATHRSASLHQTYGACDVEATDIAGNVRRKFLCAEEYAEDFSFQCVPELPAAGSHWYTVCGRPYASFARWMGAVSALGVLGALLYSFMLGAFAGAGAGDAAERRYEAAGKRAPADG
jgi:hypothetical protein